MLEQYLNEKGITIADISAKYPELAALAEKYINISLLGSDEYQSELDEIGNEILLKISEKTESGEITSPKQEVAETTSPEEQVILENIEPLSESENIIFGNDDIILEGIEEVPLTQIVKNPIGYFFDGIEFSRDGFMKVLSFLGISYRWRETEDDPNKKYWIIDENNYLITIGENPFTDRGDLYIVAEPVKKEEILAIVQSKSLGYNEKTEITTAPSLSLAVKDVITSDDKELVTGIPYKLVDETIQDLYRIESMPELITLMELSRGKKYACGCGHI